MSPIASVHILFWFLFTFLQIVLSLSLSLPYSFSIAQPPFFLARQSLKQSNSIKHHPPLWSFYFNPALSTELSRSFFSVTKSSLWPLLPFYQPVQNIFSLRDILSIFICDTTTATSTETAFASWPILLKRNLLNYFCTISSTKVAQSYQTESILCLSRHSTHWCIQSRSTVQSTKRRCCSKSLISTASSFHSHFPPGKIALCLKPPGQLTCMTAWLPWKVRALLNNLPFIQTRALQTQTGWIFYRNQAEYL